MTKQNGYEGSTLHRTRYTFLFFFFVIPRYEGSALYCTRYFTYASIDPSCLGMTKQKRLRGIYTLLYSLCKSFLHGRAHTNVLHVSADPSYLGMTKQKGLHGIYTPPYSLCKSFLHGRAHTNVLYVSADSSYLRMTKVSVDGSVDTSCLGEKVICNLCCLKKIG